MSTEVADFHAKACAAIYLQGILTAKLGLDPDRTSAKDVEAAVIGRLTAGADKVLRCAFCGEPYPEGTPTHKHDALAAHIRGCAVHPVGVENRELRAVLQQIADMDYRGNRSRESELAFDALGKATP